MQEFTNAQLQDIATVMSDIQHDRHLSIEQKERTAAWQDVSTVLSAKSDRWFMAGWSIETARYEDVVKDIKRQKLSLDDALDILRLMTPVIGAHQAALYEEKFIKYTALYAAKSTTESNHHES